jgi:hypothetical protein
MRFASSASSCIHSGLLFWSRLTSPVEARITGKYVHQWADGGKGADAGKGTDGGIRRSSFLVYSFMEFSVLFLLVTLLSPWLLSFLFLMRWRQGDRWRHWCVPSRSITSSCSVLRVVLYSLRSAPPVPSDQPGRSAYYSKRADGGGGADGGKGTDGGIRRHEGSSSSVSWYVPS